MSMRESTALGLDILEVQSKGDHSVTSVAFANRKIKSYISQCAESLYRQTYY